MEKKCDSINSITFRKGKHLALNFKLKVKDRTKERLQVYNAIIGLVFTTANGSSRISIRNRASSSIGVVTRIDIADSSTLASGKIPGFGVIRHSHLVGPAVSDRVMEVSNLKYNLFLVDRNHTTTMCRSLRSPASKYIIPY
jgi:hypothetical protein